MLILSKELLRSYSKELLIEMAKGTGRAAEYRMRLVQFHRRLLVAFFLPLAGFQLPCMISSYY